MNKNLSKWAIPIFLVHFLAIRMTVFATTDHREPIACSKITNEGSPASIISLVLSNMNLFQHLVNGYHPKKANMYVLDDIVKLSAQLSVSEREKLMTHARRVYTDTDYFRKSKVAYVCMALFDPIIWEQKLFEWSREGAIAEELYSYGDLLLKLNQDQKNGIIESISENYALAAKNKINREWQLPGKRALEAVLRFLNDADVNFDANVKRFGVLKAYELYALQNQAVVQKAGFGNYQFSQMLRTYKLFQNYLKLIPDANAKVYFTGSFVSRRANVGTSDLDLHFEGTNNYRFQRLVKIATGRTIKEDVNQIFSDHSNINFEIEDAATGFSDKGKALFARYGEAGGILIEISARDMRLHYYPAPTMQYVDPRYPEAVRAPDPIVYPLEF